MKQLILFMLFPLISTLAQTRVSAAEVYERNDIVYLSASDSTFTGTVARVKSSGRMLSTTNYVNGKLTKRSVHYNSRQENGVASETEFYSNGRTKKENKFHIDGTLYSTTWYDENGKKTKVEEYENDEIVYSCGFKFGKKDGAETCRSNDGGMITQLYIAGKKVQ